MHIQIIHRKEQAIPHLHHLEPLGFEYAAVEGVPKPVGKKRVGSGGLIWRLIKLAIPVHHHQPYYTQFLVSATDFHVQFTIMPMEQTPQYWLNPHVWLLKSPNSIIQRFPHQSNSVSRILCSCFIMFSPYTFQLFMSYGTFVLFQFWCSLVNHNLDPIIAQ